MKILLVAQVENADYIREQIAKQTVLPDEAYILVDENPATGIEERRKRIAENHQFLIEGVKDIECDLIWQVEQDCHLPVQTLETLLEHYQNLKGDDFGYVSGVQIGRHGIYCLGAWHVAEDRKSFKSADYKNEGLEEVDATGFYSLLAEKETWLSGKCGWDGERYGPDVVWGLSINKKKYIDHDLVIGHKTEHRVLYTDDKNVCNVEFKLKNERWGYEVSN